MQAGLALGIGPTLLMLLLGTGGSGLLGLPPGERSKPLIQAAPADAVMYSEWSSRGQGQPGAPGIDGLAADPEVREFLAAVRQAILASVERETAGGNPIEEALGKALPPLVETMLMQPGCLYLRLDEEAAAKAHEAAGGFAPLPVALKATLSGALIVDAGEQAEAFATRLTELLNVLPLEQDDTDDTPEGSGPLNRVRLPVPPVAPPVTLHRQGTFFILGVGEHSIDEAIDGLTGKRKEHLGTQERFAAALNEMQRERVGGVAWLDTKTLLARVPAALGPQGAIAGVVAVGLGLNSVDSVLSVTSAEDGVIRTQTRIATDGGTAGLLALTTGRGITPADMEHIPADADVVSAFSLNLPKILAAARQMIGQADQGALQNFERILESLQQETGIELEEGLFQAFGDVWTISNAPSSGGPLFAGAVASLEIRDQQQAAKVFAQLMKIMGQAVPGETSSNYRQRGVFFEKRTFMGHEVYFINTVGDDDIPFAPAFCLTKTHLLATLHPQPMKAELRFLAEQATGGKAKSFASRFDGIAQRHKGDVLSFSWVDTPALTRGFYSAAPFIGQVIASTMQSQRFELDVFSLPSARALMPYVSPGSSTMRRTKQGLTIESDSGLPIPGGTSLFSGTLGIALPTLGFRTYVREAQPIPVQRARPAAVRGRIRIQRAAPPQKAVPQRRLAP